MQLQAFQHLTDALRSHAFRPPMLPLVAKEALNLAQRRDVVLGDMAQLIQRDQVLAARFLSVANSPLYRAMMPATSVKAALTRIGLETARDVLIYAALEPFLFTCSQFKPEMEMLRRHSLATSVAATHLARLLRMPAGDAGLAGLVHDIGAAALLKHVADNMPTYAPFFVVERGLANALEPLHTVAGARICQEWHLPQSVAAVIAEHHRATKHSAPMVRLVAAADELATRAGGGSEYDIRDSAILDAVLGQKDLTQRTVGDFKERIAEL
jgi:putative nucleotidyltransferase with HDIG domain